MMKYIYTFFLLLGCSLTAHAQGYHRVFTINDRADTTLFHLNSVANAAQGDIYSLFSRTADDFRSLVFQHVDKKGKKKSLFEIRLGENQIVFENSNLYHDAEEGLIYCQAWVGTPNSPDAEVPVLMSFKPDGSEFKSIVSGPAGDHPVIDRVDIHSLEGYYESKVLDVRVDGVLSRISTGDTYDWSYTYERDGTTEGQDYMIDAALVKDSTIALSGYSTGEYSYQLRLDTLGNILKGYKYAVDTPSADLILSPVAIAAGSGSNIIEAGNVGQKGYVMSVDSFGAISWSVVFEAAGNPTTITGMTFDGQNNIALSGYHQYAVDSVRTFTTIFTELGDLFATATYANDFTMPNRNHMSISKSLEGSALVFSGVNDQDTEGFHILSLAEMGNTPCSDTVAIEIDTLPIVRDTLVFNRTEGIAMGDSIDYEIIQYNGLEAPVLNINPRNLMYCPNETIDTVFKASVSGVDSMNVMYEWSTGDLTDTARVMDEGQYTVTVTITENVCYMLCDTVEIMRTMLPMASIDQNDNGFCDKLSSTLTAGVEAGTPAFTYEWSTGETTRNIEASEFGTTYTVKVKDMCGDSTTASLQYQNPNSVSGAIVPIFDDYCETGNVRLIVNPSSVLGSNNPEDFTYVWSTGETAEAINVTAEGDYSLVITDNCSTSGDRMINVSLDNVFRATGEVNNDRLCDEGVLELVPTVQTLSTADIVYSWSSNESTETIDVNTGGTYTVTITQGANCSQEVPFEANFPAADIKFAQIFFPGARVEAGSADEEDLVFGPIVADGCITQDAFTDYTFKIYNRFGNEVFATNDPTKKWDGNFNGELVDPELYTWFVTYRINEGGELFKQKGNITVAR